MDRFKSGSYAFQTVPKPRPAAQATGNARIAKARSTSATDRRVLVYCPPSMPRPAPHTPIRLSFLPAAPENRLAIRPAKCGYFSRYSSEQGDSPSEMRNSIAKAGNSSNRSAWQSSVTSSNNEAVPSRRSACQASSNRSQIASTRCDSRSDSCCPTMRSLKRIYVRLGGTPSLECARLT